MKDIRTTPGVTTGRLTSDARECAAPVHGHSVTSTRFLDRPAGRIAYDETGTGPLVVMIPGIGDVRQQYRFLAPRLAAAGYRAVTMDPRGIGDSTTDWDDYSAAAIGADIVALVQSLNAGPAHLIGNSMGAGAAAWAAAESPDLVQSLTLIGPFVRGIPPVSLTQAAMYGLMINVGLQRPWGASAWTMYYSSLYPTRKPADFDVYRDALKANIAEKGRLEAVRAMLRAKNPLTHADARLGEVRARTLVVMGSADPDFAAIPGGPAGEAEAIAKWLNAAVLMVDGAGHYPHVEMADQVFPAIIRFLDGERVG